MTPDPRGMTLVAYHNRPELKDHYVAQVKAHRMADEIMKGAYVRENGVTGYCAVGCVLHDPEGGHKRYETELGVPEHLARLEDAIFEGLPDDVYPDWPLRFMEAIPVGADLSMVWPRFAVWMLTDSEQGVARFDLSGSCERVAGLYQRRIDGDEPTEHEWAAAERAARAAEAVWAAEAAWAARAAGAARAARAAWAAGVAREAARAAFCVAAADRLEQLLREAPVSDAR